MKKKTHHRVNRVMQKQKKEKKPSNEQMFKQTV